MITFFLGNTNYIRNKEHYELPHIVVTHSSWNDWWEFQTLYHLEYFDLTGIKHELGGVKIGAFRMAGAVPQIPEIFTTLDDSFFSVGQDVSYYENIKDLGDEYREAIHEALHDISFDEDLYERTVDNRVTYRSLMRSVSTRSVVGQFNRLANGNAALTPYDFNYSSFAGRNGITSLTMSFQVNPRSYPPSNIHVIIGRNGVGKTHLINNMIESLLDENAQRYGKFNSSTDERPSEIFANLVSVTFSAFDESEPKPERKDKRLGISYSYIGLRAERKEPRLTSSTADDAKNQKKSYTTKSPIKLKNEFVKSALGCKAGGKLKRLRKAIHALEADIIFQEADLTAILDAENGLEFEQVAGATFNKLSSGHKIVLLTITRLVETLEERSLVLVDEPEAHLHPPLLSAFVRALSDLLILQNAVAIVATHSPVVLQEVPRSCCWKLWRVGQNASANRLDIESFGENVGSLTQEVFGLEVTDSGFHKLLQNSVEENDTYEDALEKFNGQLGLEARAILRVMAINKNN